jgi:hypothetical protein
VIVKKGANPFKIPKLPKYICFLIQLSLGLGNNAILIKIDQPLHIGSSEPILSNYDKQ